MRTAKILPALATLVVSTCATAIGQQAASEIQTAWNEARAAHVKAPRDAKLASALVRAFLAVDRAGTLNVGAGAESVRATLGKPDRSSKNGTRTRDDYGFLSVVFDRDRVVSVLDRRGMRSTAARESLRFSPTDKRTWRPGHRFVAANRSVTEYVLPGERVQDWTQLVTHERYIDLARRTTVEKFVGNLRRMLAKLDPDHEWREHARTDRKIIYEWIFNGNQSRKAQRELATVVFGAHDVHRLAFASKGKDVDETLRASWLRTMRAARVQSSTPEKTAKTGTRSTAKKAPKSGITRRLAWELGSKLSLAAILASKKADATLVQKQFGLARTMARGLGVEIPDLPEVEGKSSARAARVLGYLLKDVGTTVQDVRKKHDRAHALLMETAIKSNATLLLYNPEDDMAQTIATRADKACHELDLPKGLWQPAVQAIRDRASFKAVKDAIFKMHKDVSQHLSPRRARK